MGLTVPWPLRPCEEGTKTNSLVESYTLKLCILLISTLLVLCSLQSSSTAATLQFVGGNVFPNTVPTTSFTAPSANWSFSFTVDSQSNSLIGTDAGFDVNFSNFSYSLNGAAIQAAPQIRFFCSLYGGMLDINFVSGPDPDMDPVTGIALTGPSMFSGSTSAPTLLAGSYTASNGTFWLGSSAVQPLGGTVVNVIGSALAPVPEPDTVFGFVAAGVCLLFSGIMRWIRTRNCEPLDGPTGK